MDGHLPPPMETGALSAAWDVRKGVLLPGDSLPAFFVLLDPAWRSRGRPVHSSCDSHCCYLLPRIPGASVLSGGHARYVGQIIIPKCRLSSGFWEEFVFCVRPAYRSAWILPGYRSRLANLHRGVAVFRRFFTAPPRRQSAGCAKQRRGKLCLRSGKL